MESGVDDFQLMELRTMAMRFGDAAFQRELTAELERICLPGEVPAGLAASGRISPEMLLAALRATPSRAGLDALRSQLIALTRDDDA